VITALVLGALAVFAVWEYLLDISPWWVPPVLQPLLVGGLGYLAAILPASIVLPVAIAGAVLILHTAARREPRQETTAIQLPRSGRRTEIGSRIPGLP
jgi:hypothetical protein